MTKIQNGFPCWKVEVSNGSNKIVLFCPFGELEHLICCAQENSNVCSVTRSFLERPILEPVSVSISSSVDEYFKNKID